MNFVILTVIFVLIVREAQSSIGDHSPYYQKCVEKCGLQNCTEDGLHFIEDQRPIYLSSLQWSCEDECRYECMWSTVAAFHHRNWRTPQFYGKWPFIRFFGIQEPASAFFSLLNFYAHVKMIKRFRKEVPSDSPLYWLWHYFCFISLNAWLWSTIFHTRDFPITELMDYVCAFSVVLMSCYCMIIRLCRNAPKFILVTITTFFVAFLANHVAYLGMGRFDYGYNMQLNVFIGTFTAICWFGWSTYNRIRQPYVWKCAVFVALGGLVMLLEIMDRPPFFWTFDCHSLWHLSTAPLICLFYSFVIDDCKYLHKLEQQTETKKLS
ncbi:post-GPI attachment to proteins factor 3 [Tenebrio molitor]|jgi:hypothetical protein|uniref:post-GPI attachment to proteins factor 3 n=1 Tax=Tenebrio molitor TaxID=7067 RepID=UPI003624896A